MSTPEPKSDSAIRPRTPIKAPRGLELSCKGWAQEAALRLLMNSLDEEVAERPRTSSASGGAADVQNGALCELVCDWECFEAIVRSLRALENDETLLVHSGKPVGIFRTHENAPRVLVCNDLSARGYGSDSYTSHKCGELEPVGIIAYRQISAASWMYIGSQEIVGLMFEIFSQVGEQHFAKGGAAEQGGVNAQESELAGKLIVSGGMGHIGGVQPLAATMAGAAYLGIDVDPEAIKRRLRSGYCDFMVNSLDEALRILKNAVRKRENISVGLVGNCADIVPELAERGVVPDILTALTPAHDPRNGYVPNGMGLAKAFELRARDPDGYEQRAREAIARQVEAMLRLQSMGSAVFDFGNNIRAIALEQGIKGARDIPGVVQYVGPLFCNQRGPLRYVALSGAAGDIANIDELALQMFPHHKRLRRWIELARQRLRFQGLPARMCWLGYGEQVEFALAINRLVQQGKTKGPVALGQDRLDCALASRPQDESKHISNKVERAPGSPLLSALLNAASGASLVSIHQGVAGAGCSQQMIVADGSDAMAQRIERVLTNSAGFGVVPQADAD